jgi:hypothetical protein
LTTGAGGLGGVDVLVVVLGGFVVAVELVGVEVVVGVEAVGVEALVAELPPEPQPAHASVSTSATLPSICRFNTLKLFRIPEPANR